MEQNNVSPTPIYWGPELITYPTEHDGFTYQKEWDGESPLITGLHPETGLPVILPPADHKTPKVKTGGHLNYSEAELDEIFSNV